MSRENKGVLIYILFGHITTSSKVVRLDTTVIILIPGFIREKCFKKIKVGVKNYEVIRLTSLTFHIFATNIIFFFLVMILRYLKLSLPT